MPTLTATAALLLALGYLAATFGWRTLVHWRATGTTGYRGVAGGPRSVGWWGGLLFVLAGSLMLAAPVLALAGLAVPPDGSPAAPVAAVGLVAALAGITLALFAQREMGVAWRIGVDAGERTTLITGGVFAYVRNPFFTAMVAVAAGLVALVPTAVSALAVVCLVVAVEIQVRSVEEPYLTAVHGSAYTGYAVRAGRFLPRVGRLRVPAAPGAAGEGRPRPPFDGR